MGVLRYDLREEIERTRGGGYSMEKLESLRGCNILLEPVAKTTTALQQQHMALAILWKLEHCL